jgi:hypothetical protein
MGLRPVLAGPFGYAQGRLRPATTQFKFLLLFGRSGWQAVAGS